MPTLPWGEQRGLGLGWQGRGRGCPRPEPGSDAEAQLSRARDVPAVQHCSGLSMDTWWIRAGAGPGHWWPLLPMSVLAAEDPAHEEVTRGLLALRRMN